MSLLSNIVACAPDWISFDPDGVSADVFLPKASGGTYDVLRLEFKLSSGKIEIRESNHIWPRFCPERHINLDGWFCLGLNSVPIPNNDHFARLWWSYLEEFLRLQYAASRGAQWPADRSLAHGSAGETEEKLQALIGSSEISYKIDILQQRLGGWLRPKQRKMLVHRNEKGFANGQMPCIIGCSILGKKVTREKCPNRELLVNIIFMQGEIEKQEKIFWKSARSAARVRSLKCCGFSDKCKLPK